MNNPCLCEVMSQPKNQRILSWILQGLAAAILVQTLFFKFTGAEESRYIFSKLDAEPWGRIGSGVAELVAAAMLLTPRWAAVGALMTLGLMTGALASHLTRLGIVILNDGGLLFALACTVWIASAIVLWLRRVQIPWLGSYFMAGNASARAKTSCDPSVASATKPFTPQSHS